MPITHQIRPDFHLIVLKHIGVVPDGEFLKFYLDLYSDDKLDLSYDYLIDLRYTDSSVRSTSALAALADTVEQQYKGTGLTPKIAVIAPNELSFGLSRMYEEFSSLFTGRFAVFKSVDTALAWLHVSSDVLSD